MIQGYVTEALDAVIEIGLKRGEATESIPAVVDTGFSGYLCLSKRHEDKIEMAFHHVERYELANGEVIAEDVFRGTILFDERAQLVDLILTASQDTLVGASLLKGCEVVINYPRRSVRIKPVESGPLLELQKEAIYGEKSVDHRDYGPGRLLPGRVATGERVLGAWPDRPGQHVQHRPHRPYLSRSYAPNARLGIPSIRIVVFPSVIIEYVS